MTDPAAPATISAAPFRQFVLAAGALTLIFLLPLAKLIRFATADDLHSHILLIPFISYYLFRLKKNALPGFSAPAKNLPPFFLRPAHRAGMGLVARALRPPLFAEDQLMLTTLAFVLFLAGLGAIFLGGATFRALAFPFALLVFLIPLPVFLRAGLKRGCNTARPSWRTGCFSCPA